MAAKDPSIPAEKRHRPRTLLLIAIATILAVVGWTVVVGLGAVEGWWRRPLATASDTAGFATAAKAKITEAAPGNVAFVLLDKGQIVSEHYASIGAPIDRDTLFQVASLSKWVTAWGVMTLVESGRIDLDAPVSTYLTRWRLPDGEFDESQVTVRRLLSHTAGLTDGLGYAGFEPGAPIQSLEDSLTRAADASPGRDGRVVVGAPPGDAFEYSGGGYTLLQLIIEEVTREPFNDYMQRAVLQPLGMTRSTFILPEGVQNLAQFFDTDGTEAIHYRFTATGAASLYTSAGDMVRLLQAHLSGANGEPPGRGVLRPETLELMRQPNASQFGADIWGLGTILFASNNAGGFVIGHDGTNMPAINTAARVDPASGNGIVVFETGETELASDVGGEWVLWATGHPDLFTVVADVQRAIPVIIAGWLVGLAGAIGLAVAVVFNRRRKVRS